MIPRPLLDKIQKVFKEPILIDEPMKNHTTWRIGGPTDCLVQPTKEQEIIDILSLLHQEKIPYIVIGNGSNLLVSDQGLPGVVIKLGADYASAAWNGYDVEVQAGMMLRALSLESAERSLGGIEFAAGIPGSIGGAVRMNAGAYGSTIGEFVTKVVVIEYTGTRKEITADSLNFAYRYSSLFDMPAVVSMVHLRLLPGDKEASFKKIREWLQIRNSKQPLDFPSCGSVFRNPQDSHAGYLVEQAGLRGRRVGEAMVSPKHGNFIINLGNAKASDVRQLIMEVQDEIERVYQIRLEPEVRILGEF
ncbi:MAG: UDP-N-acetylmuramate dehydrogenase [Bacillota bacterium]|jgi:UDP-N-acetylmuramate dehydrogenase